jgi:hypothetical protein
MEGKIAYCLFHLLSIWSHKVSIVLRARIWIPLVFLVSTPGALPLYLPPPPSALLKLIQIYLGTYCDIYSMGKIEKLLRKV